MTRRHPLLELLLGFSTYRLWGRRPGRGHLYSPGYLEAAATTGRRGHGHLACDVLDCPDPAVAWCNERDAKTGERCRMQLCARHRMIGPVARRTFTARVAGV